MSLDQPGEHRGDAARKDPRGLRLTAGDQTQDDPELERRSGLAGLAPCDGELLAFFARAGAIGALGDVGDGGDGRATQLVGNRATTAWDLLCDPPRSGGELESDPVDFEVVVGKDDGGLGHDGSSVGRGKRAPRLRWGRAQTRPAEEPDASYDLAVHHDERRMTTHPSDEPVHDRRSTTPITITIPCVGLRPTDS
jgi:hypothetical protein